MNDLINTVKFETSSKELKKVLKNISTEVDKGEKAGENIAKYLLEIRTKELWKNGEEFVTVNGNECKNFGQICDNIGMSRQQGYKLSSAYDWKYNEESLIERLANFKLGQITEMVRLSVTDVMILIDEGSITSDMTLKAIRQAVDDYKKSMEAPEETPAEESADDTDDTEDLEVGDELPTDENVLKFSMYGRDYVISDIDDIIKVMKYLNKMGYGFDYKNIQKEGEEYGKTEESIYQ